MSFQRYALATVGVFTIVAAFSAWQMSRLNLWGHWTLFFFIGIWGIVASLIEFRNARADSKKYFLLLSTLSALLLALAFPPFGFTPLIFIGFVPLFFLQKKADEKKVSSLFYVYNAFVLWNIFDTFWVANAALVPGFVAIWLNSAFMMVPWLAARWTGIRWPRWRWWFFALFWISFEYIHMNWEISWPWLTLGNAWSSMTQWIQWYEFTGVFGGSLWSLMLNVLIFEILVKENNGQGTRGIIFNRRLMITAALILIPLGISLLRYHTFLAEGKYGEVCLVQPNYEPHYEKFTVPEIEQITRLGRLAEININKDTKFIVFPETSIGEMNGPVKADKVQDDNRVITFYDFIESHFNIPIVMGVTTIRFLAPGEKPGPFMRMNPRIRTPYEIANSAVILKERTEKNIPVYKKTRLVPGPEIFPYRHWLPFLKPLVDKLGGSIEGLATQQERTVFDSKGLVIAPVICYESIYGDFLRGYMSNGAQAIVVMTNDGWWDDTPGYRQHMAYSKLRAIEFRKPVMRSANTGISCFIDAKGDVGKSLDYNVHSSISQGVTFSSGLTFYALHGDFLAVVTGIAAALIILFRLFGVVAGRFFR